MFAELLPAGTNLPMLLRVRPTLVWPGEESDYFAHDQVATWGANQPGLPEDPSTPYYRTFATRVDDEAHLSEFVVPMVSPSWNDQARTEMFRDRLGRSDRPTAVAVSTLDISQPAMHRLDSSDDYAHWGLTHFLLDGQPPGACRCPPSAVLCSFWPWSASMPASPARKTSSGLRLCVARSI